MSAATVSVDQEARPLHALWHKIDRGDAARTLFVASCTVLVAVGVTDPWPRVPVLAIIGLIVGCWPIVHEAFEDIRARRMSMELSMLIAIAAAGAIGEWVTALLITTFVLAAEILEDLSLNRGKDALVELMKYLPQHVRIRCVEEIVTVPLGAVTSGDILVVAPGELIAVDGIVTAGQSTADQSRITGEPLPVNVFPGCEVFAGSVNQIGALEVRATHVGADSSYGRIVEAVRHAQESQAPAQRLADRLAGLLVYLALGGAALTYLITRDVTATISVVVVAGACGIAAGTPLAVLAAIARSARTGAFIKDGAHLEELSTVNTVLFDKTGTVTTGQASVQAVLPDAAFSHDELVALTAAAEQYSEHPLGQAIVAYAKLRMIDIPAAEDFTYQPGLGVTAKVNGLEVTAGNARFVFVAPDESLAGSDTHIHVSVNGTYAGSITLADTVRQSAGTAIAMLHQLGLRTVMMTGDQPEAASAVASALAIDDVRASLMPEDKFTIIDELRASGARVAMVGDGVNDAPALARANVGIAIGSGTDIARETADVVLISSDLCDIARTIEVAQRARRIVLFNFVGTIVVDVVGMVLAAFGLLGPVVAALIHVGSETAFILNSARLIPGRRGGALR